MSICMTCCFFPFCITLFLAFVLCLWKTQILRNSLPPQAIARPPLQQLGWGGRPLRKSCVSEAYLLLCMSWPGPLLFHVRQGSKVRLIFEILFAMVYLDAAHSVCPSRPRLLALPVPPNPWRELQLPGKSPCLVTDLSGFVEGPRCPESRIGCAFTPGLRPFCRVWQELCAPCLSCRPWWDLFTRCLLVSRFSPCAF